MLPRPPKSNRPDALFPYTTFVRYVLERIAEGEVAEHHEEGLLARGIADILEVVVLAARAHAFLRRRRPAVGPLLGAGEDVLELHHAGVGEHQGRIVARHQRRGRHHGVAVPGEVVEEGAADVVDGLHVFSLFACGCASSWNASNVLARRSEEHTSELQSLMRISYAVFCLKKKK